MRRAIGGLGRALVTIGLLILAFVAYQLWGTAIFEARQQSRLKSEFHHALAERATTTTTPGPSTPTTTPPPPPSGDAIAVLRIPAIGVEDAVVQGVEVPELRNGPGHYPLSPFPGQLGNAAIAGHRTTYGAPFNRLDELHKGDVVALTTLYGTYRYKLDRDPFTVKPTQIEVLLPAPDPAHPGQLLATLTLTTCNPKYSAAERLVAKATLDQTKSARPQPTQVVTGKAPTLSGAGLSGAKETRVPTIWWGLAAVVVGGLWWLVFHRYRRFTTWFGGLVPFLAVLFFFYAHLERLLPGNY